MRRLFLLLFLLTLCVPAWAQNPTSKVIKRASYPVGQRGDVFVNSTTGTPYACKAATCLADGTGWTPMDAGAVAPAGAAGQYQKNSGAGGFSGSLLSDDGADVTQAAGGYVGFKDKGSQVFNLRAYGAVGDGAADDWAAIHNAIALAKMVRGTVYGPPGIYRTTRELDIDFAVTVQGAGTGYTNSNSSSNDTRAATVFLFDDATAGESFVKFVAGANNETTTGVILRDFAVVSTNTTQANQHCLVWSNTKFSDSRIDNLFIKNFTGYGINLTGAYPNLYGQSWDWRNIALSNYGGVIGQAGQSGLLTGANGVLYNIHGENGVNPVSPQAVLFDMQKMDSLVADQLLIEGSNSAGGLTGYRVGSTHPSHFRHLYVEYTGTQLQYHTQVVGPVTVTGITGVRDDSPVLTTTGNLLTKLQDVDYNSNGTDPNLMFAFGSNAGAAMYDIDGISVQNPANFYRLANVAKIRLHNVRNNVSTAWAKFGVADDWVVYSYQGGRLVNSPTNGVTFSQEGDTKVSEVNVRTDAAEGRVLQVKNDVDNTVPPFKVSYALPSSMAGSQFVVALRYKIVTSDSTGATISLLNSTAGGNQKYAVNDGVRDGTWQTGFIIYRDAAGANLTVTATSTGTPDAPIEVWISDIQIIQGVNVPLLYGHVKSTQLLTLYGTAPPANGDHIAGDMVRNTAPAVDGNGNFVAGWVCTAAGSPGTWTAINGGPITASLTAYPGNYFGSVSGTVTAGGSSVFGGPGFTSSNTVEANRQAVSPRACTAKRFYLLTSTAQPNDAAMTAKLRINGADSGIVITVSANSAAGSFSDLTDTAVVNAGDKLAVKFNNASASASANVVSFSWVCE
jgi:hypothetical protein